MVEKVLKESDANNVEPFKEKMANFLEGATQRIERQFMKLENSQKLFIKAMVFYKFIPKSGTLEDTTPGQFFECWTSFAHDFRDIWKKEMAILSNEL
jgi:formin 2